MKVRANIRLRSPVSSLMTNGCAGVHRPQKSLSHSGFDRRLGHKSRDVEGVCRADGHRLGHPSRLQTTKVLAGEHRPETCGRSLAFIVVRDTSSAD